LESANTIHSWRAACQPLRTLLSFGLLFTRSSPMSRRASADGCSAISDSINGMTGSSAEATQNRIS